MTPTHQQQSRPSPPAVSLSAGLGPAPAWAGDRRIWIGLAVVALVLRVAIAFLLPPRLMWPDAKEFEAVGRMLYQQGTYGLQTLRPPGYPTLIAGVYRLFGPSLIALRLVEAVLSTLAAILIGRLGLKLFGRLAGVLAMAIAALHPLLAFMSSTQYTESTSVLVMMLVLAAAYSALDKGGGWRWGLTGLLLGAHTLVRPNAIALLPGLGLGFALLLNRRGRGWLMPVVVTGLAFGLSLLPWMVRNHNVHHRWFFISTGGGRQLWLGNNPNATCITTQDLIIDPQTRADLDRLPDIFSDDRYLYGKAMEFIRDHPGHAARLYLRKLGNIFALYPETLTGTYVNPASRWGQGVASVIIFAGALLALVRLRSEPALWPMVLGSLTFVLATALVLSSMRYRLIVEPVLILMAAVGFARAWPSGRSVGAA